VRLSGWLYLTQQTLCALCMLIAAGRTAGGMHPAPHRAAIAAVLCGGAAMIAALFPSRWLRAAMLLCTAAAPLLACAPPRRRRLRIMATALCITLGQAGVARLLDGFDVPAFLLPLLCGGATLLVPCASALSAPPCAGVEVTLTATLRLTALVDTGNLLRDPLTHLPVIVVSRRIAARLTDLPAPGELRPGMRLISVRTAAGRALMTVVRPQSVRILQHGGWREARALIGISPDGYDGFSALLPACLIRQAEQETAAILSQGG